MSDYLLQEDGTSKFVLEDASGDILLEFGEVDPSFIASVSAVYTPTVAYSSSAVIGTSGSWLCPPDIAHVYVEAIGGGGGGATRNVNSGGGGGGGAYAARVAVPVTPGTLYTVTIGAGGGPTTAGGDTSFTGDSGTQVIAKGGSAGQSGGGTSLGGAGGQASASTGDTGLKFDGGHGGDGVNGGGGGGASANRLGAGAAGSNGGGSAGGAGGTGANGGGSGGAGGSISNGGSPGITPGGAGGGAGSASGPSDTGGSGADGQLIITIQALVPPIASVTQVFTPTLVSSANSVHPPFIASTTVVYAPTIPQVDPSFIQSRTHVWGIFSLFDPDATYAGPGNGGEIFAIRLAANGSSVTATLAANISADATALELTGDGSLPSTEPFVATIDSEVLYLVKLAAGSYRIRRRGVSNTTPASHTAGASVVWGDSYEMAIRAGADINASFTANIESSGSFTYDGWLICFDSTQAYLAGDRYPMHVTEVLGVFDAGAGSTGTNRCDGAQPNAIAVPTGTSDHCAAALSNPALITTDIATGDVALIRYTNPEASVLDLGPRAAALQSWFGLKRVDSSDADVTLTDPTGYVVDTIPSGAGPGPFTGSVEQDNAEPLALATGIAPDASDAVGAPVDTPNTVPWETVTLPGTDRYFTRGSGSGGFDEKGWPMCCIAVRQGNRRIPHWQSWDWKDYSYVYTGFGTDDTFAQLLINRNGIVFGGVPVVDLPGSQDIDGPDTVWDDASYYFSVAWYVVLFGTPYLVFGPTIGGTTTGGAAGGSGTGGGTAPGVTFPPGGPPVVTPPPIVEGGGGGDIIPPTAAKNLFQVAAV